MSEPQRADQSQDSFEIVGQADAEDARQPGDSPITPAQSAESLRRFREHYEAKRAGLEAQSVGQYVAIQIRTGAHVVAPTSKAALDLAKQTFGSTDWCWTRQIGTY